MTARHVPPEHKTVQTVIYFIGSVALVLAVGCICLVGIVIASGRDIAPASVAVLATITGLAGTAIGSLASMLVSTRPSSPPAAGDPTTFVAPASSTVTVKPAVDPPVDPGLPALATPTKTAPRARAAAPKTAERRRPRKAQ